MLHSCDVACCNMLHLCDVACNMLHSCDVACNILHSCDVAYCNIFLKCCIRVTWLIVTSF